MSSRSLLLSANCINIFCTRFGNTCKTKAASLYATHEIVSEQCFCMKFCNSTKSGQGSISYCKKVSHASSFFFFFLKKLCLNASRTDKRLAGSNARQRFKKSANVKTFTLSDVPPPLDALSNTLDKRVSVFADRTFTRRQIGCPVTRSTSCFRNWYVPPVIPTSKCGCSPMRV